MEDAATADCLCADEDLLVIGRNEGSMFDEIMCTLEEMSHILDDVCYDYEYDDAYIGKSLLQHT